MTASTYQAVIFDLDGVLTDTAHYHFLAWQQLAKSLDIELDVAFNEQIKGIDRMGSLNMILAKKDQVYSQQQKVALAEIKNQHYQQLIATISPANLMPGALNALQTVRQRGLKIGLASISKNAAMIINQLQIQSYFDVIVDAATIKNSKPHPEIFLTAAHLLQVPVSRCLGVEDAVAGVAAIKAAGMFALGIGKPDILLLADSVIPDLREFDLDKYEKGK